MNPGKRYLRNTVFAMWGVAFAFVGLNRLYASVAGPDAPEWRRNLLSLGLRVQEESKARPEMDLATAKDFTKVSVYGNLTLEIVGAAQYKVTFTPPEGTAAKPHAFQDDAVLHVHTDDSVAGGILHIEVPTLEGIDTNVPRITLTGLSAKVLAFRSFRAGVATLQQNHVESWRMVSYEPLEVRIDDATFAAGSIKSNGDITIRRNQ